MSSSFEDLDGWLGVTKVKATGGQEQMVAAGKKLEDMSESKLVIDSLLNEVAGRISRAHVVINIHENYVRQYMEEHGADEWARGQLKMIAECREALNAHTNIHDDLRYYNTEALGLLASFTPEAVETAHNAGVTSDSAEIYQGVIRKGSDFVLPNQQPTPMAPAEKNTDTEGNNGNQSALQALRRAWGEK